ncbi:thiamine pyrophosphate-binding protein [Ruminococcaceae bacterium OttesenSCG-928-A16]|nr:thiamine pyrophosphate-binding protein [Ruminococcaceae bacterium OttesenSCG-928-A16]
MIRVADYVAKFLSQHGIDTVYLVSGGGMMFLLDGLACNPDITVVSNHHEQASAMAAVAHAKYTGLGCAYLTTGCGGTNAITGVLHAWQDGASCFFVSGQCKRADTIRNSGLALRQVGAQEADIVALVEPITKYAVMVNDPQEIRYHLEKALYLATTGRPGPVWVDVPLDVQSSLIDESTLKPFTPPQEEKAPCAYAQLVESLKEAKRPVIIAGNGVRLSHTTDAFGEFVKKHQIPYVATRLAVDVQPFTADLYIGRMGSKGTRAANFAVQNADLILVLGARLSIGTTGYEYDKFAPYAKIVVVDIDPVEHQKSSVSIDEFIECDLRDFFADFPQNGYQAPAAWRAKCLEWKEMFPLYAKETHTNENGIDLYYFTDCLSRSLAGDDVVVADAGSATNVPAQALILTDKRQRYITSGGQAEMGFTLPATVGLCMASGHRAIGITGDGSLQMNIQELQTIAHYNLPAKIFVWNNAGYLSIRNTQNAYFEGRKLGSDYESGVTFPDLRKLADAYGIKYILADKPENMMKDIADTLAGDMPVICEVMCDPGQQTIPSVTSRVREDGKMESSPLDDMAPFLPRDVYEAQCVAKLEGEEQKK